MQNRGFQGLTTQQIYQQYKIYPEDTRDRPSVAPWERTFSGISRPANHRICATSERERTDPETGDRIISAVPSWLDE
jgi:hypothetical protein